MDREVGEVSEAQAKKGGQIEQDLLARGIGPSEKEKPRTGMGSRWEELERKL